MPWKNKTIPAVGESDRGSLRHPLEPGIDVPQDDQDIEREMETTSKCFLVEPIVSLSYTKLRLLN